GDDSGVEALRPERVDQLVRNGGAEEIPAEAEREIDVLSNPPPAGAEAHLRPVDVASVIPDGLRDVAHRPQSQIELVPEGGVEAQVEVQVFRAQHQRAVAW